MTKKIGILLTNTGTPDAPDVRSVRRYLGEFLSDKRIVKIPHLIWLPILYGIILTTRPQKSAKLYQTIWLKNGAPMRVYMQELAQLLEKKLNVPVEIGMNYGSPSIAHALDNLQKKNIDELIVVPLYPQYSNTTTASTFDHLVDALKKTKTLPNLTFIRDYANHPTYIQALAKSVQDAWQQQGKSEHLLISFHGIPERFIADGDPYQQHCEQTAHLLAQALDLPPEKWTLCYQSQFGYDKWLKPSTQALFIELPKRNIRHIDVVCPGFAVDCLETLEEIAIRGKETFIEHGGQTLRYIPALNASDEHVQVLTEVISLSQDQNSNSN